MSDAPPYNVEAVGLRKVYPGVTALDGVTLGFAPGETHALIGKNGAGKSTLVKILAGAAAPTSGAVRVAGQPVRFASPRDALAHGVATVYQEFSLVPGMSVAENILLGAFPTKWGGVAVDWRALRRRARAVLNELGLQIDPAAPAGSLSVASQQMTEIAKAVVHNPRVLMLDEPTSALAHHETEQLFRVIRQLTARGVAVVYISHRLQELREIAARVSILRDGRLAGTIGIEEADGATVAELMFGALAPAGEPPAPRTEGRPLLTLKGLAAKGRFQPVDLTLREGEVLGIAGLLGSGRTELLRAIAGADPISTGTITIDGTEVRRPTVARMKALGVAMTPEDRKAAGLVSMLSVRENLCMASLDRWAVGGVTWRARQLPAARGSIEDLGITARGPEQKVETLSGGNQQKVVVGKWLHTRPRVLLFDEPTRGIDIHAKRQMFQIMEQLSGEGIGIIFVSSELEELLQVGHRILIMRHGRIEGAVSARELTARRLFELCAEGMAAAGQGGAS